MSKIPPFLLEALQFQNARWDTLHKVADTEWERVLSDWHVIRLTLPLREVCGDELPTWVRERIDVFLGDNALRFEQIKRKYAQAAEALKAAGVEHVVIKGFSLWPSYAEHPKVRPQSDIDLYCTPETISRARDALLSLGYTSPHLRTVLRSDHLSPLLPSHSWVWRGNYFDPEIPIAFELHFCWWDNETNRIRPQGLEQFWPRRVMVDIDGFHFPALDPVDNLGYTALNLLRSLLRQFPAVEQVYGLARFLHIRADDGAFWQRWRSLHHGSLRSLEAISFRLASEWFGCRLPDEVCEEVSQLAPSVHQWFRHFSSSAHSSRVAGREDGVWLHLALLDSLTDKFAILFQRVAPLPARAPTKPSLVGYQFAESSTRKGRLSRFAQASRKFIVFIKWLVSRSIYHYAPLPRTLWRGMIYQLSRKSSSGQL
jgi:Uncharacterised nucleotidyltransferase